MAPLAAETRLPLELDKDHLLIPLNEGRWIVDTGAPGSFGRGGHVDLGGRRFDVPATLLGLDADELSRLVGTGVDGLLGADILNRFDWRFDLPNGEATASSARITGAGEGIDMDFFMEVPRLQANIDGRMRRLFFDTGAPISYYQDDGLKAHPASGTVLDFYPGFGSFETETFALPVELGGRTYVLRTGQLPGLLGMTLGLGGVDGIVGNAVLRDGAMVYSPVRKRIWLNQD